MRNTHPLHVSMKEPTITVAEIETLARKAFGEVFVRLEVKARVRRSETITIYIREGETSRDWTHKLVYAHDRPRGDPDAVRKHVRTNLEAAMRRGAIK